jgi:hypothetical protein
MSETTQSQAAPDPAPASPKETLLAKIEAWLIALPDSIAAEAKADWDALKAHL